MVIYSINSKEKKIILYLNKIIEKTEVIENVIKYYKIVIFFLNRYYKTNIRLHLNSNTVQYH